MHRASISAYLIFALAFCAAMPAIARNKSAHQQAQHSVQTDQEIFSSAVYIAPTTLPADSTSVNIGADRWIARGFGLKELIAQVYDIDIRRIDLAENVVADRYDVVLTLPADVDADVMQHLLEDALQKKFNLRITLGNRAMDVYVLSAPEGPGTALHAHLVARGSAEGDAGQVTYDGRACPGVSSASITASAEAIGDFSRTLEPALDRPLIDETHLAGSYNFQIGAYANQAELFNLMHTQLGLVVTPTRRDIPVLTVRPTQTQQAKL